MIPPFTAVSIARRDAAGVGEWVDGIAEHASEIIIFDSGCEPGALAAELTRHPMVRVISTPQASVESLGAAIDRVASHPIVAWLPVADRIAAEFWSAASGYLRLLESGRFDAIQLRQADEAAGARPTPWSFRRHGLGGVPTDELRLLQAVDRIDRLPVPRAVRFGVSILVHEQPDVVVDQVTNFRRFLDNPVIVLHVNRAFADSGLVDLRQLAELPGVIVNPEHRATRWGGTELTLAIVSNFTFLDEVADFDVFVLHGSNDLYVRSGAERRAGRVDAGFAVDALDTNTGQLSVPARNDIGLQQLQAHLGGVAAFASGHEGTFFDRQLFRRIAPVIDQYARVDIRPQLGLGAPNGDYGKEEFYFPTAAAAFAHEVGDPLVYRDWWSQPSLPIESVEAVLESRWDDLPFRVGRDFYAVKRVARRIDDPVRRFIRDLPAAT